jgi:predicted transcriptional regulator
MLRSSIPLGRIMGVDVRVHLSFPVLLIAAVAYGIAATGNAMRGVGLWCALLLAVLVREVARSIAAAYVGMRLRALFLMPVGGVMALSPPPAGTPPGNTQVLTLAAPLANIAVGLILLGVSYASAPGVHLFTPPWIAADHILRSFIWMQFILAAVNLLASAVLPTERLLRGGAKAEAPPPPAATAGFTLPGFSLMTGMAVAMLLAGLVTANIWLILLSGFVLVNSQMRGAAGLSAAASSDGLRVHEVMLTDWAMLSNSDTLRGALERTAHSLQDVFPVVRGDRLVGSVSRQTLADHFLVEGDGYLQGLMTRAMQVAAPQENLVAALGRTASVGPSEFIPVVENGRVLGILTPQSLARAVQQVKQTRTPEPTRELPR